MIDAPLFKSATVEWGTPPDLFWDLNKEFHFTLDPCRADGLWDAFAIDWTGHRVFCNPPYGRGIGNWLAKQEPDVAVFLLPARTDTGWFHDYALKAQEIRFFRGRLAFHKDHIRPREGWLGHAAPFPSMLVIYRKFAAA
jgi:hypothetical protein